MTADDENNAMFQGWSAQDMLDWFERQPDDSLYAMSKVLTAASPERQLALIRQLRHIANDPAFSDEERKVAREILRLIIA